jgi:glutamate-ammonia-ligase adenylyltransferase
LRRRAAEATSVDEADTARFDALRRFRRRETLRIALLDMEGQTWRDEDDFNLVVRQISDLAQVCVQEALRVLGKEECLPFAVIGMGKLGARELNYSSDIDLIFLHDGDNAAMQKLGETLF